MTADARPWTVRLTKTAESDYQRIIRWTRKRFGDLQALNYADTLAEALGELTDGPGAFGARTRSEIGKGLYTLHAARAGRKGRHFVMFRVASGKQRRIEVLRILHDSMDLKRHIPDS